jgi:hypothetical protein
MNGPTTQTFTIQFREQGAISWDYVDGHDRAQVRRVFARLHPKARILVVREN